MDDKRSMKHSIDVILYRAVLNGISKRQKQNFIVHRKLAGTATEISLGASLNCFRDSFMTRRDHK